jgi:hypothetical protein
MARIYRRKFFNHTDAMLEILEASYEAGGRGIETAPAGKLLDVARIMKETHGDYVITGSTLPGPDPRIEDLIKIDTKIIFIHASVSDNKDLKLQNTVEDISSRGVIPGIAAHNPVETLEFALENLPEVKAYLIPFNRRGMLMGNKKKLEEIVNNHRDISFLGIKTLAAGKIEPEKAFDYVSQHNICAVAIGMVEVEEAKASTNIALEALR